jgi:hypothetical protein
MGPVSSRPPVRLSARPFPLSIALSLYCSISQARSNGHSHSKATRTCVLSCPICRPTPTQSLGTNSVVETHTRFLFFSESIALRCVALRCARHGTPRRWLTTTKRRRRPNTRYLISMRRWCVSFFSSLLSSPLLSSSLLFSSLRIPVVSVSPSSGGSGVGGTPPRACFFVLYDHLRSDVVLRSDSETVYSAVTTTSFLPSSSLSSIPPPSGEGTPQRVVDCLFLKTSRTHARTLTLALASLAARRPVPGAMRSRDDLGDQGWAYGANVRPPLARSHLRSRPPIFFSRQTEIWIRKQPGRLTVCMAYQPLCAFFVSLSPLLAG